MSFTDPDDGLTARFPSAVLWTLAFAAWLATVGTASELATKRVLLLSQGPDGHPPSTHEYEAGIRVLAKCLDEVPNLEVTTAHVEGAWDDGPNLIRRSDAVVLYLSQGAKWIHEQPRRLEAFGQLAGRRGGLVTLHWAMGTKDAHHIDGFLELFGGCHGGPDRKYQVVETDLSVIAKSHPILRGIGDFRVRDEFYYQLKFVTSSQRLEHLLTAKIDGQDESVAWAWQRGDGGRSFGFSGGHFHENWRHVEYRRLVAQGILWSVGLDIPEGGLPVIVGDDDLRLRQK